MVLVHGVGLRSDVWSPQIAAFSTSHRVIVYDTLGHGGSDLPPEPASLGVYVAQLEGLLDALGVARAVVIGHSMGGLVIAGMLEGLIGAVRLFPYNWASTPACTHIETVTVRWLGQLTGYADNAAGYVTTGGTWANMMGLALARHHRAGWDVQAEGLADHPRLIAYVSPEGHACIEQSIRLLGIGANQLRRIAVDDDHRIRVDLLEDAIRADLDAGLKRMEKSDG